MGFEPMSLGALDPIWNSEKFFLGFLWLISILYMIPMNLLSFRKYDNYKLCCWIFSACQSFGITRQSSASNSHLPENYESMWWVVEMQFNGIHFPTRNKYLHCCCHPCHPRHHYKIISLMSLSSTLPCLQLPTQTTYSQHQQQTDWLLLF